jgi:3-deoxy-D-manno-octulosonic-acid transferase
LAFASSREGEEIEFLKQFEPYPTVKSGFVATKNEVASGNALPETSPILLIIPRHPQRFDEVASIARQQGFTVSRRSTWGKHAPDAQALGADVWIGDSLGEMPAYASLASVALLGGSFAPLGGQNLIELLACGCPVVMGPHTFNFADAAERAEEAGVAIRAVGMAEGVAQALELLRSRERSIELSASASQFVQANAGALLHTVRLLQGSRT